MAYKQDVGERRGRPGTMRDASGRFVIGYSGNPAGRPVLLAEVRAAARARALESIATLVSVRDNLTAAPAVRAAAADRLLQWAYGGAATLPDAGRRDLSQMSDAELAQLEADEAARAATISGEYSEIAEIC